VDTQDTNPTDGLSLFLELANDAICLGNEDYEVFYYHSTIDAENDLNNTESINPTYRNEVPDDPAKVTQANATCYSMGSITHENRILLPKTLPVI
jgi:hypothetical protein